MITQKIPTANQLLDTLAAKGPDWASRADKARELIEAGCVHIYDQPRHERRDSSGRIDHHNYANVGHVYPVGSRATSYKITDYRGRHVFECNCPDRRRPQKRYCKHLMAFLVVMVTSRPESDWASSTYCRLFELNHRGTPTPRVTRMTRQEMILDHANTARNLLAHPDLFRDFHGLDNTVATVAEGLEPQEAQAFLAQVTAVYGRPFTHAHQKAADKFDAKAFLAELAGSVPTKTADTHTHAHQNGQKRHTRQNLAARIMETEDSAMVAKVRAAQARRDREQRAYNNSYEGARRYTLKAMATGRRSAANGSRLAEKIHHVVATENATLEQLNNDLFG